MVCKEIRERGSYVIQYNSGYMVKVCKKENCKTFAETGEFPDKVNAFVDENGNKKYFYKLTDFIINRDGNSCQKCKAVGVKLHVHHIQFKSHGGSDSPDNLISLCKKCHSFIHKESKLPCT